LNDKFTGHPKGHAYVEFADPELLQNAMLMNETTLLGRNIQVSCVFRQISQSTSRCLWQLLRLLAQHLNADTFILLQVLPKRTNLPSFILNRGRGRGGYRGGRGSQRAAYHPYRGTRGRCVALPSFVGDGSLLTLLNLQRSRTRPGILECGMYLIPCWHQRGQASRIENA
jgi:RNA recognition motif-containing protein